MFPRLPRSGTLAGLALGDASAFVARAEANLPQFRSVLIDGQAPMFSHADATGSGRWVKIGESFEGWKLETFDSATQVPSVSQGEERKELTLISYRVDDSDATGAATLAEADAVLQEMRFEEMIQKTIEAQQEAMAKSMGSVFGKDMPEAERARFTEFQRKMMAVMFEEMGLPGMRKDVARIYAENFSSTELKA